MDGKTRTVKKYLKEAAIVVWYVILYYIMYRGVSSITAPFFEKLHPREKFYNAMPVEYYDNPPLRIGTNPPAISNLIIYHNTFIKVKESTTILPPDAK